VLFFIEWQAGLAWPLQRQVRKKSSEMAMDKKPLSGV